IHRQTGNRQFEANTLANIGIVYGSTGQPQKALDYFQQALPLYRAVGDKNGEANALNGIGHVYKDIGQPQTVLDYYQQALTTLRQTGNRQDEALVLYNTARAEWRLHRLDAAQTHLAQAVALLEQIRDNLGGYSQAKQAFLASHLYVYDASLSLLLERHQTT